MRKGTIGFALAVLLTSLVPTVLARRSASVPILEFRTMVGVFDPFLGSANPIRGVNGAGAAWKIEEGRGELREDGKLEIKVRGLVLLSGVNPVPNFRGLVSCMTVDELNLPTVTNVSTGDFPATNTGDSDIEASVQLPEPCIAPIVFVTSPGGSWFAVTGN